MYVELHGRSHPAPKLYEGDLLSGSWTLWVSRVEGVQGFLRVSRFQRSNKQKVLTIFKGPGRKVFNLRGHGFKGLICQSSLKCVKGSRTSGAKGWRGSWVNHEVRGFRRSLKVDGFKYLIIQGFRASRVIGFQDMWGYIFNVSPGRRVSLAGWGFRDVWRFQNPRVSGN